MSHASPDRYRFIELFGQVPWFATLPEERRNKLRAGMKAEQEAEALAKLEQA